MTAYAELAGATQRRFRSTGAANARLSSRDDVLSWDGLEGAADEQCQRRGAHGEGAEEDDFGAAAAVAAAGRTEQRRDLGRVGAAALEDRNRRGAFAVRAAGSHLDLYRTVAPLAGELLRFEHGQIAVVEERIQAPAPLALAGDGVAAR